MTPGLALLRSMRAPATGKRYLDGMPPGAAPRRFLAQNGGDIVQLANEGAIVKVRLGQPHDVVEQLRKDGKDVPGDMDALAMIDTGASITAVDRGVAERLGLTQTGSVNISGVTGVQEQPIYAGRIQFDEPSIALDPWRVVGSPIGNQGFHILVGRDALRQMTLVYDGASGTFNLGGPGFTMPTKGSTVAKVAGVTIGAGGIGLALAIALGLIKV